MLVSIRDKWLVALLLPTAVGLAACSQLDPATDTCLGTATCQTAIKDLRDGGTPDLWVQDPDRWKCLDPSQPQSSFTPSAQASVNLSAVVLDYSTLNTIPGLTMKFCLTMDPVCNPPAAMAAPMVGTPLLNLAIKKTQEGYLRQEAPGYVTQDYYLLAPMLADDMSQNGVTSVFTLVSQTAIAGFIADMGINVDPTLGIIAVFVTDCAGNRVENATLTLPELGTKPELAGATPWAINGRLPVPNATTDKDGTAGFVNLPEGTVAVEASVGGHSFGLTRLRTLGSRLTGGTIRPVYQTGL